ncbi:MAG: FtsQ-type POTRA domain-containing protein, partial [Alphaproteobacteria bacterium]
MRQLTIPLPQGGRKRNLVARPARRHKASLRRRMPRWLARALAPALIVLAGLAVAVGGVAAWRGGLDETLAQTVLAWSGEAGFAVDEVLVEGRKETEIRLILASLGVERGTPLFGFSPDAARERLLALGWVAEALVERRLPDTVYVRLRERRPAAIWQRDGSFVLVDASGAVIGGDQVGRFRDLWVIVGEDAPAKFASLVAALSTQPALAKRVTAAVRISRRRWNVRMDNGVSVL